MATLLIRNLDDSVREALRALAHRHGRSVEAEVRAILVREAKSVLPMDWDAVATVDTGRTGPVNRDLINNTYVDPEK